MAFNGLLIALIFVPITFVNPNMMRVVQYFSVYIMILIPDIINSFKGKERSVVLVIATMLITFLFVRNNPRYLFYWQDYFNVYYG